MRRRFLVLIPLFVGCGTHEKAVSRVVLPSGVHRPAGLRPDPPAAAPLTPPASHIQQDGDPVPPADEQATANLGTKEGPGVEAVCRYDESGVSCWGSDRTPAPTIGAQIKSLLSRRGDASLPLTVGRKTRLVVALTPTDRSGDAPQWTVQAAHPGSDGYSGTSPGAGADGRTRSIVLISEKPTATTSALRFVERTRLPQEVPIALKPGASASLGGYRLTVSKVEKLSDSDMDRFFVRNRPAWRVVLTRSGSSAQTEEFFPVDPYPVFMADGRRASFGKGKFVYAPKDAPTIQTIDCTGLPRGAVAMLLDHDPAKVKRLSLGGWTVRSTVLDGVPLDPKG